MLFIKGQPVNILGFVAHIWSLSLTLFKYFLAVGYSLAALAYSVAARLLSKPFVITDLLCEHGISLHY